MTTYVVPTLTFAHSLLSLFPRSCIASRAHSLPLSTVTYENLLLLDEHLKACASSASAPSASTACGAACSGRCGGWRARRGWGGRRRRSCGARAARSAWRTLRRGSLRCGCRAGTYSMGRASGHGCRRAAVPQLQEGGRAAVRGGIWDTIGGVRNASLCALPLYTLINKTLYISRMHGQ